jgi:hypothetical protein
VLLKAFVFAPVGAAHGRDLCHRLDRLERSRRYSRAQGRNFAGLICAASAYGDHQEADRLDRDRSQTTAEGYLALPGPQRRAGGRRKRSDRGEVWGD